jgi:hypothetical protein
MTNIKTSPREVEKYTNRKTPGVDKCHPLLQVLRMMIGEAHRYQQATCHSSTSAFHARSMKAAYHQLDHLWKELKGEPLEKYEFLRNRLALVLLWQDEAPNADRNFSRCLMNPPSHMSNVVQMNRQRLLNSLRPGELFVAIPKK